MDIVYVWHDDKYRSNVLFNNTPNHACNLKVKVTDFEHFLLKFA